MNIKQFPAYIMIVLILLQSFSAVAKVADVHIVDSEHIKTEHVHALDDHISSEKLIQSSADNDQHNPADCHHCGHCNGSHVQFATHVYISRDIDFKSSQVFYYLKVVIEAPPSRLLRPPKS